MRFLKRRIDPLSSMTAMSHDTVTLDTVSVQNHCGAGSFDL